MGWWTLQCTLRSGKNCLVEQWTRPLLHYEEEEGDGKEEEQKEEEGKGKEEEGKGKKKGKCKLSKYPPCPVSNRAT